MDRQILDYLPQEVLTDIFTRVPIKSLLLCTLVCKSWHTFVTDPSFVIAHLNRPRTLSHNNAHDLILLRNYSEQRKEEVYSLRFDDESFREYQKIEFPFKSAANDFYRIVGCCNGVVCITDDQFRYAHDTVLWNPSIRKSVTLPKPRISEGKFEHVMGFGFDRKTNDYKVVRIVYLESRKRPEIDVYRLSSGSWEDISRSGGLGFYSIRKKAPQAYLNGAVHWFATDKRSGRHLVVSFDTGDELFRPIVVPDGVGTDLSCLVSVRPAVFLGDLALIECKISTGQENWGVWVMREYGVAESWTEHLCLEVGQVLERMVGFRKSGELLVEMSGGKLLSYDPETEEFTELEVDSNVSISTWFHAEGYKESLVLLGRYGLLGSQVHGEKNRVERAGTRKRKARKK